MSVSMRGRRRTSINELEAMERKSSTINRKSTPLSASVRVTRSRARMTDKSQVLHDIGNRRVVTGAVDALKSPSASHLHIPTRMGKENAPVEQETPMKIQDENAHVDVDVDVDQDGEENWKQFDKENILTYVNQMVRRVRDTTLVSSPNSTAPSPALPIPRTRSHSLPSSPHIIINPKRKVLATLVNEQSVEADALHDDDEDVEVDLDADVPTDADIKPTKATDVTPVRAPPSEKGVTSTGTTTTTATPTPPVEATPAPSTATTTPHRRRSIFEDVTIHFHGCTPPSHIQSVPRSAIKAATTSSTTSPAIPATSTTPAIPATPVPRAPSIAISPRSRSRSRSLDARSLVDSVLSHVPTSTSTSQNEWERLMSNLKQIGNADELDQAWKEKEMIESETKKATPAVKNQQPTAVPTASTTTEKPASANRVRRHSVCVSSLAPSTSTTTTTSTSTSTIPSSSAAQLAGLLSLSSLSCSTSRPPRTKAQLTHRSSPKRDLLDVLVQYSTRDQEIPDILLKRLFATKNIGEIPVTSTVTSSNTSVNSSMHTSSTSTSTSKLSSDVDAHKNPTTIDQVTPSTSQAAATLEPVPTSTSTSICTSTIDVAPVATSAVAESVVIPTRRIRHTTFKPRVNPEKFAAAISSLKVSPTIKPATTTVTAPTQSLSHIPSYRSRNRLLQQLIVAFIITVIIVMAWVQLSPRAF